MSREPDRSAADLPSLVPFASLRGAQLAPGEPDVRGWPVVDVQGRAFGVVADLLVDRAANDVAAIAVEAGGAAGGTLTVLPMTDADIDARSRCVVAHLTPQQFAALPRGSAHAGAATPVAGRPADHPGVTIERTPDGGEVVRVPVVEEELVVERRPVVKEMVVIRKRPVQEQRVVEADLRRERIEVDRRD